MDMTKQVSRGGFPGAPAPLDHATLIAMIVARRATIEATRRARAVAEDDASVDSLDARIALFAGRSLQGGKTLGAFHPICEPVGLFAAKCKTGVYLHPSGDGKYEPVTNLDVTKSNVSAVAQSDAEAKSRME